MCRSTGSLVPVGLQEWHRSCAGPSCCTTPSRSLARLTRVPSTSVFALLVVVQCLGARMRVAERASLCARLQGALGFRAVHISLVPSLACTHEGIMSFDPCGDRRSFIYNEFLCVPTGTQTQHNSTHPRVKVSKLDTASYFAVITFFPKQRLKKCETKRFFPHFW